MMGKFQVQWNFAEKMQTSNQKITPTSSRSMACITKVHGAHVALEEQVSRWNCNSLEHIQENVEAIVLNQCRPGHVAQFLGDHGNTFFRLLDVEEAEGDASNESATMQRHHGSSEHEITEVAALPISTSCDHLRGKDLFQNLNVWTFLELLDS